MRPHGTKEELETRRMRAMTLLAEGKGVCVIASELGVWPGSVSRWKAMYERGGKEGLTAKRHPGGTCRMSEKQKQRLPVLLAKGPRRHGYKTDLWTLRRIADLIERNFGISYDPSQVWRILRGLGWTCQKPERRARERDEAEIRHWRRYCLPAIKKSLPPRA